MKKVARIISSDARFVRMLTLELIELGITVVSDFTDEPDTFCYTIADLDICEQDTLREMSESSHLIGFSQKQEDEIVDRKSICATTRDAVTSFTSSLKNIILSFKRREYMS